MKSRTKKGLLAAIVTLAAPGAAVSSLLVAACVRDSCFVAGTLVSTPDGPRAIESLRVGDVVWSYGFAERRPVARPLLAVHRALARETRRVELAGGRAIRGITPSHPVFSPESGLYLPASQLAHGDTVSTYRAESEPEIAKVSRILATEVPVPSIEVFNLGVAGSDQNYFADGVLVHNKSYPPKTCTTEEVQVELVAVDASAGNYAVRVTVREPRADGGLSDFDFFVGEGGDVPCDAPTMTAANEWTCTLKPLTAGKHELYVSGYASPASGTCMFQVPLTLVAGAADGGTIDAAADAAPEADAASE
jgi:hypothetical protein